MQVLKNTIDANGDPRLAVIFEGNEMDCLQYIKEAKINCVLRCGDWSKRFGYRADAYHCYNPNGTKWFRHYPYHKPEHSFVPPDHDRYDQKSLYIY